jgi:hypothetical protein
MSLFISNENQQILYEMIHKDTAIHRVFGSQTDNKNIWFRSVIEMFYKQISQNITREELKTTNRRVLAYMIQSLKEKIVEAPVPVPASAPNYNTMFDVPKPKAVDFSEKIEDTVITNMEELIETHKKMREKELQEYIPVPDSRLTILQDVSENNIRATVVSEKKVQFNTSPDMMKEFERIHTQLDFIREKMMDILDLVRPRFSGEENRTI